MVRKIIIYILCIVLFTNSFGSNNPAPTGYHLKTVVIDAGHGGHDPGALGANSFEKNITLAIALKLGEYIKKNMPDVKVIFTRETDVFVELINRAEIANKNQADLFISIHVNSNKNISASGVDTWVMGQYHNAGNFSVAKEENKVILIENDYSSKYEGFDPTSAESYIIFNLMQNAFIGQSLDFATEVQNSVQTTAKRKDRGVQSAPFFVLWKTTMPSVLIETGFISNQEDESFLISANGQDLMASSIYNAFKTYKERVENKTVIPIKKVDIKDSVKQIPDTSTIYFACQVKSSLKKINDSSEFSGYSPVTVLLINDSYKYLLGKELEYNKILLLRNELKAKFPDVFIIALQNGNKIPLNRALEIKRNKMSNANH